MKHKITELISKFSHDLSDSENILFLEKLVNIKEHLNGMNGNLV